MRRGFPGSRPLHRHASSWPTPGPGTPGVRWRHAQPTRSCLVAAAPLGKHSPQGEHPSEVKLESLTFVCRGASSNLWVATHAVWIRIIPLRPHTHISQGSRTLSILKLWVCSLALHGRRCAKAPRRPVQTPQTTHQRGRLGVMPRLANGRKAGSIRQAVCMSNATTNPCLAH